MSQLDRVVEKLETTSPVSIIVVMPTMEDVFRFQEELQLALEWNKVRRGQLEQAGGSVVSILTDRQAYNGVRGRRVDYLSLHDDVTWRAIKELRPCADSLI